MDALSNEVPLRNVIPSAPGGTLGGAGNSSSLFSSTRAGGTMTARTPAKEQAEGMLDRAVRIGSLGQPFVWWVGLVIGFGAIMWLSQRTGDAGEFKSIKLTVHNVLFTALVAAVGLPILKVLATRFPIPGISTVILAA